LIILILVVLTLTEWGLRQRAKFAAEAMDRANDLTFRTVLVDVGLFLHGFRQITPTAITGSLGDAVNKLRAATTGIRDVADDMKRLSASADATLTRFAELASRELEPSAKRLDSIVGSLGIAVDAHKAMGDMVRSLQRELGESLGVITSRLDDLGTNLDRRLESQTEKLEFALREMVTETEAVGKRLASASAAAEEVARSLRTAAGVR
jgi:ABC-type transporter Mla subunit MlaD